MSQVPMYPPNGGGYGETDWLQSQMQGQGTYGSPAGGTGQWGYDWSDPSQQGSITFGGYNAVAPTGNWSAPSMGPAFNFSNPSIWGSTQNQIQQMYNQAGMPTDVTPAWQAAQEVANNALRSTLANANEQFSAGRQRFSTGAGSAFSQAGADAGAQIAAQRLAMELQAQEAARARQMQAMGLGNQLGGQQADYQLGQANYGLGRDNLQLGLSGLELQNAQNEWNNQMGMLSAMMGFGNQMQGYGQSALDRMYADWGAENSMPYLNAAMQYAGQYPPGAVVQQQSALGGILGGLGSLIPGVGGLIGGLAGGMFGGGGGGGSVTPTGGSSYTGPSYAGYSPNFYFGQGYQ